MIAIVLFLVTFAYFSWNAITLPHRVLALALCMYAFEVLLQTQNALFSSLGFVVNASVALCVGLAFSFHLWQSRLKLNLPAAFWLTMALYGYAYLTLLWKGYLGTWHGRIWMGEIPQLLTILFCGSLLVDSNRSLRDTLLITLAFGTIVTIGLHFFATWHDRGVELAQGSENEQSPVLSLAQVGGYVAIIAAFIPIKWLPGWRVFRWVIVGLGLYLAFRTESRGQVVGAIAAIAFYAPMSWGAITFKSVMQGLAAILTIALCIALLMPFVDLDRFSATTMASGVGDRVQFIEEVGQAYLDGTATEQIFGLGASASYIIADIYVHNIPFEVLCEEGFVGLFILILVLAIPLKKAFGLIFRTSLSPADSPLSPIDRNTLVIVLALLTFEFLLCNKQGSLFRAQNLFLFAILLDRSANQLINIEKKAAENGDGDGEP